MPGLFTLHNSGRYDGDDEDTYMFCHYNESGDIGQCSSVPASQVGATIAYLIRTERRLVSQSDLREICERTRFRHWVAGAVRIGFSLINNGISPDEIRWAMRANFMPHVCCAAFQELGLV